MVLEEPELALAMFENWNLRSQCSGLVVFMVVTTLSTIAIRYARTTEWGSEGLQPILCIAYRDRCMLENWEFMGNATDMKKDSIWDD